MAVTASPTLSATSCFECGAGVVYEVAYEGRWEKGVAVLRARSWRVVSGGCEHVGRPGGE